PDGREVAARSRRDDPHRLGHHPGPCQSARGQRRRLTRRSGRPSSAHEQHRRYVGAERLRSPEIDHSAWPLAGYSGSGMPRARTAPTMPASAIIVSTAMKPPDAKAIAPRATPALPPRKVEALTTPEPCPACPGDRTESASRGAEA